MNAENKMTIKSVSLDDARLPSVIYGAIGNIWWFTKTKTFYIFQD